MCAYAEWLELECIERPSQTQRAVNARRLARTPISPRQIKLLEGREDFIAYCEELRKGPLETARAKFLQAFPTYVERHREALDMATEARDYNAVARLAEPVLDRVIPKKVEAGMMATQVIVQLTDAQIRGMRADYEAPPILVTEAPANDSSSTA